MIDGRILAVLFGLLSLGYGLQCSKQKTSPGREVVCYTSATNVDQLNDAICRCTTLVQQGYDLRNLSTSGFKSFQKSLKDIKPSLQFMISVDDPAKTLTTSAAVRHQATAHLMGILKEIDGIELNVTAGSKERLVLFAKVLKDELVRKSFDKRIFLVLPTKTEDLAKQFDLKELSKYVDLFTVATHYLVEDDESYHTFHPSRLIGLFDMINADSLIDLISGLGAPKRKILVSVPASVYKFSLKDANENAPRAPTTEMLPDIIDQNELCDMMSQGEWTVERDEDLTAPYAFKNKTWVAFEDKISVAIKGKYALLRDLPGLAIRDVQNDFRTKCGKPLVHEIHHSFTDFKRKSRAAVLNALEDDLHQTQIAYPTKVKSSEFRVVRVVDTEGHIQAIRENTQTEFICTKQGYFVHPKSCNRFYRCVKFNQEVEDYSVFEFDCPAGLAFDERTEVCVWPGSLPQGSPCPGSSEIAPVTRVRFECPSKPGYYADPQNPRWFFACLDLGGAEITAYEFRCPFGLIFDEQKFICEWPWLVKGYAGSGYTRPEYETGAYGAGEGQGTGGYVTGGLPHGFTGTTGFQSGGHSGGSNIGYTTGSGATLGGSSGFSGAAGVGYAGSAGKHGSTFGQGSTQYSGSVGGGYAGSTAGHGADGGGYSGSVGGGYSGSVGGGYTGAGSGYSGSVGGSYDTTGTEYTGSISGGHGTIGTGFNGGAAAGHGVTGTGYTGTAHGAHGTISTDYTGTGASNHGVTGSGYTGSVSGGQETIGTGFTGTVAGSDGAAGSGYSGTAHGAHGTISTGYTGTGTSNHGGTGTGYTGSVSGGHGVSGTGYSGTAHGAHGTISTGYTGTGTSSHGGTGTGYTGSVSGGHGVSGTGYSGSVAGGHGTISTGYTGTGASSHGGTGTGYTGSVSGGHGVSGTGYSGSVAGGHGRISIDYTGTGAASHGVTGTGYTGSVSGGQETIGSGFSSTVASGHEITGTGYIGVTPGAHGIISTDYTGTGAGSHGVTGSGYSGSVSGGQETIGSGFSGTVSGDHGVTGTGYSGTVHGAHGTISTGYTGTGAASHGVTGSGSHGVSGAVYTGTGAASHGVTGSGSHGVSGAVYTGAVAGGHGVTGTGLSESYEVTEAPGSIGGSYAGSTGSVNTGYIASTTGVYKGSSHIGSGSTDYSGASGVNVHSDTTGTGQVFIDSGYTGTGSTVKFGTSGIYGGTTGHGTGTQYSGSGAHAGAAAGSYAGSSGTSYLGTTGGYAGSTGGVSVESGTNYLVPVSGCAGSSSGTPVQTTYTGSAGTGCAGSTGGSSIPVAGGYSGSGTKEGGHLGTPTIYYSGSPQGSTVSGGVDYSGTVKHGSSQQTVTKYTGSGLEYSGSQDGYTGPGQTVIISTQPSQAPSYDNVGTTGSGYAGSVAITGGHGPTPGSTYIGKQPEGLSVNYIPGSAGVTKPSGVISTALGGDQTYLTGTGHAGVTSTYYGNGAYGKGGLTSGSSIYQGSGFTHGYKSPGDTGTLNITLVGGVTPSVGYGIAGGTGTGTILTGSNIHGSISTGDSSPGTLITYGGTSGTVISGSADQGSIITGTSQPGYIKTGTGTPGYVISEGVKTVYSGSASPGTIVYGTASPGVVITGTPATGTIVKGESSPGITLTGQTAPGVNIGGTIEQGTVVGSGHPYFTAPTKVDSTYGTKIGSVPETYNTDYKINEYHDNGGRGTIKFNNGDIITKYADSDIPDYRPTGGIIRPDTFRPSSTHRPSTPSGFTITGPTKTGITTAILGGSGGYAVVKPGLHPAPGPEKIGEKAFEGNVVGYTKSSTESSAQDTSYIDTSKLTLGPSKSTGYSYPRPSIPFKISVTEATSIPIGPTESSVLTAATPTPFLNVEVYNTQKFGKFSSVTDSPAVVDTYNQPSGGDYQENLPVHSAYSPRPTDTPIAYTTGPLKNYKSTLFEAAKIPIVSTTVHPVIDTGYKTVISSTSVPVTITHGRFDGNIQTGYVSTKNQYDFGSQTLEQGGFGDQKGYVSSTTPSSVYGVSSSTPRPFGFVSTVEPESNYGSTVSSNFGYSHSTSKNVFGQNPTTSSIIGSLKPSTQYLPTDSISPALGVTYKKPFQIPGITYQHTTPGSVSTGSPASVTISREEVDKLVTNYNRGSTKYVPSQYDVYSTGSFSGNDYSKTQSSSTFGSHYGSTPVPFRKTQSPFTLTTYSGGYTKPSSLISYQTSSKSTAVGKGKVIVKWSDLHPLLLGKLGAECTCRGDPFGNLRGPGSKLINSDRGKVDLSNYDDSEIYVDLEKDNSYEDKDYAISYESSSPSSPIKIWDNQTPVSVLSHSEDSQILEQPSSTYLPSVTPCVKGGSHGSHLTSPFSHGFSANFRSGKSLNNFASSTTIAAGEGASFDRYGPGGLRDSEETLEGATNCARPGLFRHPNFCNKFYACHWDDWKKKFTLHVFNCPVHLSFDKAAGACNWPSMGPACQDDNLLV